MKAQFINENRGIPWSGKDPTKAPIIGKLLTRRTPIGDGETMKPEILQVVEVHEPFYIINKWYKPGVPQVIHEDMVAHFIPIERYKDEDLEHKMDEVKRSEDEWANDQLNKYEQGKKDDKTVPEVSWSEAPKGQKEVSMQVARMAHAVSSLEDYVWDHGNEADKDKWREYMRRFEGKYNEWTQLSMDDLELAYYEIKVLVNNITRRN